MKKFMFPMELLDQEKQILNLGIKYVIIVLLIMVPQVHQY